MSRLDSGYSTIIDDTRGSYKTGIKPLGQKLEIKNAIKNLSEDLPPMSDVEAMFDHLVSRVSHI